MTHVVESTNPVVKAVIEQTAPRPAILAAARGLLPLPPNDLLEILVAFSRSEDAELSAAARETLASQESSAIETAVASEDVPASILAYFASQPNLPERVYETIVRNERTPGPAVVELARSTANGRLLEFIALNQQLLIRTPALIDAIIANPASTSEAERRASETKREFFEKERGAQQIASELRAQGNEAAAEFIENAEFAADLAGSGLAPEDAILLARMIEASDSETDDSWLGLDLIEELYVETPEQRQAVVDKIIGDFRMDDSDLTTERISVINRVMKMGMKDRVKLAMKGDREARNVLIRDPNRIVAHAVINNPRLSEQEVEKISAMRTVTEDVLRSIAINRQWTKSYGIIHNLARNPRTPIANTMNLLTRLQLRDLVALGKNRNVSDAVRRQAQRLVQTRAGK
jgi:hypothetical protein